VGEFPHRAERGRVYLESIGLTVRMMPNAALVTDWTAGPPEARVDDIHAAFADDAIGAVLCGIGGNHSNQLLPLLDYDLIAAHPKLFQGYSDITVLHWAFAKHAGLRTFYGPALCSELGEYPKVLDYTDRWLRAAWFEHGPLDFDAPTEWTDEFLDWEKKADLERPRAMNPARGWRSIREGVAEGPLFGGCLETICWHLKGSREWLDLSGAVLFLETSEEGPSPAHVDAYLTDLELLDVFDEIAGLIIGRPAAYKAEDVDALWRVAEERTEASGIPLLANLDVGHTDPMLTLPLGAPARMDARAPSFVAERGSHR
jgi:muramoyltetrapeptide carboxypeptidase LdcA involved in peptidoglycan recycling